MKKLCLYLLSIVSLVLCAICAETTTNNVTEVASTNKVMRCEAITKSGNQCKRRALCGKKFCRQHEKMVEKAGKKDGGT